MICDLRNLPLILDRQIANAMAIVIAMSSPITHCDYRDAETILSDLNSDVYFKSSQNCRANRRIQSFRIPMLIHLQLGLSLHSLRVYIAKTYSVDFLQSRKTSDYYYHLDRKYNAYKMKILGDDTKVGQEGIENIKNNINKFLADERNLLSNSSPISARSFPAQLEKVSSQILNPLITPNNVEPLRVIRKTSRSCNRSSVKEIKQANILKKLRLKLQYSQSRCGSKSSAAKEESIGEILNELIATQNEYYKIINGKSCLSVRTGLHVQDMISNCGCSLEKMPIIIETVLKMLFGDIDKISIKKIVKASSTYSNSAERTAALVKRMSSDHFLVRDNNSTILNSCIIMDATNKGNKSLVAKLYNYVCNDGIVRLGAFNVDNTGMKQNIFLH